MITVVEPKQHIAALWSKPTVRDGETFRMMRYVLRVDHEGKVLLHNVVTGQLVVLDQDEADVVDILPMQYSSTMEQLIDAHYLVSNQFDEHQRVLKMRTILHKMDEADAFPPKAITAYTILPTTACNARCYYCFEHGVPTVTMTEQIADNAVRFISNHSGSERKVSIRWFGGEPTVAAHRIDRICYGLRSNGIQYSSSMTTNGYLFDEEMVLRAKTLWNLKSVMISVDGTEKNFNDIKSFINAKDNPYQRVLRNIGLLMDQEIKVELRMNFDLGNYQDFSALIVEVSERFHGSKLLQVHVFPVEGEYPDKAGRILHGSDEWFDGKIAELNDAARECGLFHREMELPSLFFSTCSAGNPSSMVITAQGDLARCSGHFYEEGQIIGNITDDVIDYAACKFWHQFADPPKCRDCVFFPSCVLIEECPAKVLCFLKELYRQHEEAVISVFKEWKTNE